MVNEDEWYEIVAGEELEQGDFLTSTPVFIPDYSTDLLEQLSVQSEERRISGAFYKYNVIVMSQTCDLVQGKLKHVLVCPYWPLESLGQREPKFLDYKIQEELRKGNMRGYHMLQECRLVEKKQGIQLVEFLLTYSIPSDFITNFAKAKGNRLRLRTPYKEQLSHAFGNFFSRVALPADIPPFRKK